VSLKEFREEIIEQTKANGAKFALGYTLGKLSEMVKFEQTKKKVPPLPNPTTVDVLNYENKESKKNAARLKNRQDMYARRWAKKEKLAILALVNNVLKENDALTQKDLMGLLQMSNAYHMKFYKAMFKYHKDGKVARNRKGKEILWIHLDKAVKDPVTSIVING